MELSPERSPNSDVHFATRLSGHSGVAGLAPAGSTRLRAATKPCSGSGTYVNLSLNPTSASTNLHRTHSKWLSRTFWIVAILIAIARVFIGVHWPTDVLAGLVIGSTASLVVRRLHTRLDPMIDWFLRLFRLSTNAERMPDR